MTRIIKLPLVVILAATVAACDTTEQPKVAQRDVYNSLEDCVADWGDTELCQAEMKQAREHAEKMAAAQGSSGGGAILPIFMGPTYTGGDRAFTTSDGRRVVPQRTSSVRTANYTPMVGGGRNISYTAPNHSATARTTSQSFGSNSSTSRGGIGSAGSSSTAAS